MGVQPVEREPPPLLLQRLTEVVVEQPSTSGALLMSSM